MNFLNPLFFLGALAILAPLLLHLVRRERARKFEFPSLMFLRRVSRRYIRYQKLRHLLLLLLRALALLVIALAFARPYLQKAGAALTPGRIAENHIILLDDSMSMAYSDRWDRAKEAAARIARALEPGDRIALLLFSDRTLTLVPLTADPQAIPSALAGLPRPSDRRTRFTQGLRAAQQAAYEAQGGRRVIHLISDFQKSGWNSDAQDFRLAPDIRLVPVGVGGGECSNLAAADAQLAEVGGETGGELRIRYSLVNFGTEDRNGVRVRLSVDERAAAEKTVSVARGRVEREDFQLKGLAAGIHTIVLEIDDDRFARDNRFVLVVNVRGRVPVTAVEDARSGRNGRAPGFFLSRALNVAGLSPFQLATIPPGEAESLATLPGSVLIWNDIPGGSAAMQRKLQEFVRGGGGLALIVSGERAAADFNRTFAAWLPVQVAVPAPGAFAGRASGDFALLTDIRLDHPIFLPFAEPQSGNFSSARFYRHVVLQAGPEAQVLARFDNGDPAVIAAEIGEGHVVILPFSADDAFNDLPLKAVYAPFWQQLMRYLQRYRQERHWVEVGESIDPGRILDEAAISLQKRGPAAGRVAAVIDPDRRRLPGSAESGVVIVEKAGFYEVRSAGLSTKVAVNTAPEESDLTAGDPEEMAAGWASNQGGESPAGGIAESLSPEAQERGQALWRWLLLLAAVFFAAEGWLGNRSMLGPE